MKEQVKKPFYKKWWFWVLIVVVVIIAANSGGKDKQASAPQAAEQSPAASAVPKDSETPKAAEASKAPAATEAPATATPAPATPTPQPEISFDANGIFSVGEEVKPGLYRSEDVTYWARLSGFSGDLKEILANGNSSGGPVVVEIKAGDKGFQTAGSGKWVLIDQNYKPEMLTEFGDGTYMVGKDIAPGTYKSSGSVVYWARLKNFSGSLDSIASNGTPTGPSIVEIKSTDKGFQTNGGGTWKKIK